jgi:hypothetical protein
MNAFLNSIKALPIIFSFKSNPFRFLFKTIIPILSHYMFDFYRKHNLFSHKNDYNYLTSYLYARFYPHFLYKLVSWQSSRQISYRYKMSLSDFFCFWNEFCRENSKQANVSNLSQSKCFIGWRLKFS